MIVRALGCSISQLPGYGTTSLLLKIRDLKAVFIETSFLEVESRLAELSGRLTAASLGRGHLPVPYEIARFMRSMRKRIGAIRNRTI